MKYVNFMFSVCMQVCVCVFQEVWGLGVHYPSKWLSNGFLALAGFKTYFILLIQRKI